jgi:Zn-dependent M28 family amino/carboxypeptidase
LRSYLGELGDEGRARLALYLNFDMIASPNFARIVYDGDGTAGGAPWPEGSAAIEQAFREHFAARGLAVEERDVTGRSDHAVFVRAGIASGGVASFARGEKTHAQARLFGGAASFAVQPCYHRACDTLARANPVVLAEIARATARVVGRFAAAGVPVSYAERSRCSERSPGAHSLRGTAMERGRRCS